MGIKRFSVIHFSLFSKINNKQYLKFILKSQNNQKNPKWAPVPFTPSKRLLYFQLCKAFYEYSKLQFTNKIN